jgi:hypothetical protein
VEARSHIPRWIDHALLCLVEVCVEVKRIRAQCFEEEKRSGCIVAGKMVVLTNHYTSNPLGVGAATGEASGAEELVRCDCAWEAAAVLVALGVGTHARCMDRRTDHRMGSPIQAVHRFYAI